MINVLPAFIEEGSFGEKLLWILIVVGAFAILSFLSKYCERQGTFLDSKLKPYYNTLLCTLGQYESLEFGKKIRTDAYYFLKKLSKNSDEYKDLINYVKVPYFQQAWATLRIYYWKSSTLFAGEDADIWRLLLDSLKKYLFVIIEEPEKYPTDFVDELLYNIDNIKRECGYLKSRD